MLVAALLIGCGDASKPTTHTSSDAAARVAESEEAPPPPRLAPNPWREPGWIKPHPNTKIDHLIVREIKKGHGPAIRGDANIEADYIEANYTTGRKFLRAWKHNSFGTENMALSPHMWMPGLVRGMQGMRPGGRRVIIVPRRLSDIHDSDRTNSYFQIVYWDVVLRRVTTP